ncbi:MAG: sugar transferase [Muribaculaceae bacterium]|nr:sugar transferase [Bacteroidales bacterium]MDY4811315.1 sugar transferase [Muribaculaceae bacterium]
MQKALKRIFDIFFALTAIVVLTPLWLVIAIWILVTSPGGIFFRQKRTGYKGRTFELLKFRSMYINPEADTAQANANDPRITPIGRILRRTSLDELPQFVNILVGDMSVIGPRPHMLVHTDFYSTRIPDYMRRHDMRPGLTGLAQVEGFRGPTPEVENMAKRVNADLEYIDKFSIWLDIKILFLTIWRIVTFKL